MTRLAMSHRVPGNIREGGGKFNYFQDSPDWPDSLLHLVSHLNLPLCLRLLHWEKETKWETKCVGSCTPSKI